MRRALATLALGLAGAAALAAHAGGSTMSTACTPGPTKLGGVDARVFCGPAKAVVHVAGKTYTFSSGACSIQPGFTGSKKTIAVNIGTSTIPPALPKATYFGVLVDGTKVGTYRDQAVSWQVPGKGFAVLFNTVVVKAGGKKGSFKGNASMRTSGQHKHVGLATGSWTC